MKVDLSFFNMKTPQYIFIHHTAVSLHKNPDQWKATDDYHRKKGWNGGGYNYEVAANGSVHQFRADGTPTAAQYQSLGNVKNLNDGSAISICLDGDFDIEDPTKEQTVAVADLIRQKMEAYSIPKENVFCHRKVALNSNRTPYKSCPGTRLPDDIYSYFCGVDIPEWGKEAVEACKAGGVIKDWSNPYAVVGNERLEFALEKAGLLDPRTHEGKVTLLDLAVVLHRIGKV